MGTRISVASSVYNLAGDIKYRPQFLKMIVFNYVLGTSGGSIGETITGGYLNGPGLRLRQFARWARKSGYNDYMGFTTANISANSVIDNAVLLPLLPKPAGSSILLQSAYITTASSLMLAEDWISKNKPNRFAEEWTVDFDDVAQEFVITWPGNPATTDRFSVPNYSPEDRYLYAKYTTSVNNVLGEWKIGDPVKIPNGGPFPNTSQWDTVVPESESTETVTLKKTITTVSVFSDGRPSETAETVTTKTGTYQKIYGEYSRIVYNGVTPGTDIITSTEELLFTEQFGTVNYVDSSSVDVVEIAPGVTRTDTITPVDEYIDVTRQTRTNTRTITMESWSKPLVFLYKENSGMPSLDQMFGLSEDLGQFYSFIPFRLDNKSVDADMDPVLYKWSKKAFRRATGGSYVATQETIEDNKSIKDIDYVYTVFGVSLNSLESASQEYIYRLFKQVLAQQQEGGAFEQWEDAYAAAVAVNRVYLTWFEAQKDPLNPLYGTPMPPKVPYPDKPGNSLKISAGKNAKMNFAMEISWSSMKETSGAGVRKPNAKKGDLWWTVGIPKPPPVPDSNPPSTDPDFGTGTGGLVGNAYGNGRTEVCTLTWQVSKNVWQEIVFTDLMHKNFVYKGRSVDIQAKDALSDPEESGFIIPLHEGIFADMPLVRSTQMATAGIYLVFNSYVETKKKWYESGIFKLIVIIVAVVITAFTGGAGAGLLGTASGVGSAMGLTGLAAVVVGAVANTIAAMVLMSIIQKVAVGLFGAKWGAIIGVVVGFIAINVGTSMASGSSFAASMGNLMQAPNIMKLTMAAGDAYSKYLTADTKEIYGKMETLQEAYKGEMKEIQDMYGEEFGYGSSALNPLYLLDAARNNNYFPESTDAFTARTLMVGSDVVEMSHGLLNNFAQITLTLDMPT